MSDKKINIWPLIHKLMELAQAQGEYNFYYDWPVPKDKAEEIIKQCIPVDQQPPACPECGHPNLVEATKRACQEPTLLEALAFISVLDNYKQPADQEQKHCNEECANCDGDGCFHAELKAVHDASEQPTPEMPLICASDCMLKDTRLPCYGRECVKKQRDADMALIPAIRAQAVKEFADKIIKILDDMYKDNEIEDDNVTGWNSAIAIITRDIKAEGGIE